MKRLLILAFLLVLLISVAASFIQFPQAAINLTNYDSLNPIYYLQPGNLASGPGFYAEILGGPVGGPLQPIPNSDSLVYIFPIGGKYDPGYFWGEFGYIPNVQPRGYADFQVRAWHGAPTYEEATERVESGILSRVHVGQDYGPPDPPQPEPFPFPSGLVIVPIPEPSALLLMGLGMVGLILRYTWNSFRR